MDSTSSPRVAVLGGGAFGTAFAQLLAQQTGQTIALWCYEQEVAQGIKKNRCNERYLPNITLEKNIEPTTDLQTALEGSDYIFEAVPVKFMRSVLEKCKPFYDKNQVWVVLSKGIEKETLLLPTELIEDVFVAKVQTAVISGPSFAKELASKAVTGVDVASKDKRVARNLKELLSKNFFSAFISQDPVGVQLCGALKNILALGVGMLEAENTKALFLTKGLAEVAELVVACGGKKETVYGLCGVGDMVLTCMGKQSRNLAVGKRLAFGQPLGEILKETGFISEGINTVRSVKKMVDQHKIDLPILSGMYEVIFEGKQLQSLL